MILSEITIPKLPFKKHAHIPAQRLIIPIIAAFFMFYLLIDFQFSVCLDITFSINLIISVSDLYIKKQPVNRFEFLT